MKSRKFSVILFVLFTMVLATACSENTESSQIVEPVILEDESDASVSEESDAVESGTAAVDYTTSAEEMTVAYTGESFEKSVFAVGGTYLYVCGLRDDTWFFGSMTQGEDQFQEFKLDVGDDMRAFNMFVDSQGRCHILWMSTEKIILQLGTFDQITYEKSCVTIINSEGEISETIDTTEFFAAEQMRPYYFIADSEGNYYCEEGTQIKVLSGEGSFIQTIECGGTVETLGIGASDTVYCIYLLDGKRYLGSVGSDSTIVQECELTESGSSYVCIAAGAEGNTLIYHQTNGVYSYDGSTLKEVISSEDLPISGESVEGFGFLADGRLCLMGTESNRVFYYVPTIAE